MSKTVKRAGLVLISILIFCLFGVTMAISPFTNKVNDGTSTAGSTSNHMIGELWDSSAGQFNEDNLEKLEQELFGNVEQDPIDYVMSNKDTQTDSYVVTARMINSHLSNTSATNPDKNGLIVTLGGMKWMATSMTFKEGTDNEEIILTLYLADAYTTGITFNKSGSTSGIGNKGDNMYSRSDVRNSLLTASQWSFFAKGSFATEYLVQPKDVKYQHNQRFANRHPGTETWTDYNLANEALDVSDGFHSNITYAPGYTSGGYKYEDWGNDYIWLPSATETGWKNICPENCIWMLTDEQRSHNVSNSYSWLRSGNYSYYYYAYLMNSSGTYSNDNVTNTYGVRPALHLNLTSAGLGTAREPIKKPTVDRTTDVYDGSEKVFTIGGLAADYSDNMTITVPSGMTLKNEGNTHKLVATNAGEYEVVFTLKKYRRWENPDNEKDKDPVKIKIKIGQKIQEKPTVVSTSFTYNKQAQRLQFEKWNDTIMSAEGAEKTVVGDYTATIKLNSNYRWAGANDFSPEANAFTINWSITPKTIVKPTNADGVTEFTFNNNNQGINFKDFDAEWMTVAGNSHRDAGTYTVIITLNDTDNTTWTDKKTDELSFTYTIKPATKTKPTIKGGIYSFVYNGKEQTLEFDGFDSNLMTISGNVYKDANNSGESYTATISLKDKTNSAWSGESGAAATQDLTFKWNITPATLDVPYIAQDNLELTYDHRELTVTVENYIEGALMSINGNTGRDVGNYTVVIELLDKRNSAWKSGGTANIELPWKIIPRRFVKPTIKNDKNKLEYNEKQQYLNFDNFVGLEESWTMYVQGNSGTFVQKYTATITLGDTKNTVWDEDGSTDVLTYEWEIIPKPLAVPTIKGSNSFVYKNSDWTLEFDGYDDQRMRRAGHVQSQVDDYTATISLRDTTNYQWDIQLADGEDVSKLTAPQEYEWHITPVLLTRPELVTNEMIYEERSESNPLTIRFTTAAPYDKTTMNITGNTGKDVGDYTAVVTIIDTDNYKWADGTVGAISYDWTIVAKYVKLPKASARHLFKYQEGVEHTYTPIVVQDDLDKGRVIIYDNVETEKGKYTAKVKLSSTLNYVWVDEDGNECGTDVQEFEFKIIPPGVEFKTTSGYDFIYADSNAINSRKYYGTQYTHTVNDSNITSYAGGKPRYILGNIKDYTTIDVFLDNLESERSLLKVYDSFGNLIYDGTINQEDYNKNLYVGTGFKVELCWTPEADMEVLDTIYLSVLGDLTGDGMVDSSDETMLSRALKGPNEFDLYAFPVENILAAYLDNKRGISETDLELLHDVVTGKIKTSDLFADQVSTGALGNYAFINLENGYRVVDKNADPKYVGNIAPNTTVKEFKEIAANLFNVHGDMSLFDGNGVAIKNSDSADTLVGTGWKVQIGTYSCYISVIGDVTGDGLVDSSDVAFIRRLSEDASLVADMINPSAEDENLKHQNIAKILAATITNRGIISSADGEIVWRYLKNGLDITQYI